MFGIAQNKVRCIIISIHFDLPLLDFFRIANQNYVILVVENFCLQRQTSLYVMTSLYCGKFIMQSITRPNASWYHWVRYDKIIWFKLLEWKLVRYLNLYFMKSLILVWFRFSFFIQIFKCHKKTGWIVSHLSTLMNPGVYSVWRGWYPLTFESRRVVFEEGDILSPLNPGA